MLLIGTVAGRRARLLSDACARAGVSLEVVEWSELLVAPDSIADVLARPRASSHVWCKIETPSDDPRLDAVLIARGARLGNPGAEAPPALAPGELGLRDLRFLGFADALRSLVPHLAPLRLLNGVEDILVMCDKLVCQRHLEAHGIPVPRLLGEVASFECFDAAFPAREFPAVFIKSRFGSSAAGVVALRRHPDGRLAAYSSAHVDDVGAVHNRLRVRRYGERRDVARVVDAIARQGAYAECWTPKPRLPGDCARNFDLRVVAAAGRPRQRIARISHTPMTNLHLGNARAAPEWLSDIEVRALEDVTARAAASFPRSACIGFDVMVDARGARVFEANAFGDLLPGLRFHGRTTYEDQAELARCDEAA